MCAAMLSVVSSYRIGDSGIVAETDRQRQRQVGDDMVMVLAGIREGRRLWRRSIGNGVGNMATMKQAMQTMEHMQQLLVTIGMMQDMRRVTTKIGTIKAALSALEVRVMVLWRLRS